MVLAPFSPSRRPEFGEHSPGIAGSLGCLHARRDATCMKYIRVGVTSHHPDDLR